MRFSVGELKAVWIHADYGHGTGLAIGAQSTKFEGKYEIKYFDSNVALANKLTRIAWVIVTTNDEFKANCAFKTA
jgi:hypothetical protein